MADKARLDLWMDKKRKGKDNATYWSLVQQEFYDQMAEEMALHAKEKGDFEAVPFDKFIFGLAQNNQRMGMKMLEAFNNDDFDTAMKMNVHAANFSFMMFEKLRAFKHQSEGEERGE